MPEWAAILLAPVLGGLGVAAWSHVRFLLAVDRRLARIEEHLFNGATKQRKAA